MNKSLPITFPPGINVSNDYNPAIRLFGKRFLVNQSIPEFMVELLTIAFSEKWIGENNTNINTPFPSFDDIKNWPENSKLNYKPPIKLNLKLFAFLSSSRIDTRHDIHKSQYEKLWNKMKKQVYTTSENPDEATEWVEELLRGFRGAGFNRTWCAQTFFPISTSLLTQETIWKETAVKRQPLDTWKESMENFHTYYDTRKHNFMARGGEVLYLQLCNVFTQEPNRIEDLASLLELDDNERSLKQLHQKLQNGMENLYGKYNKIFDSLVEYIEGLDTETSSYTKQKSNFLSCEWCPEDSWQEGYMFAVEISRLLNTALDPVERLELFMTGCSLQVLRSLCSQSYRYAGEQIKTHGIENESAKGSALKYAWIFSPTTVTSKHLKLNSQRNLQTILGLIQNALRNEALIDNAKRDRKRELDKLLNEADDKYGYKLFLLLGKKLGIIAPYKGPGARFIMTDSILRYMVITLLHPGESCTYESFLKRLYSHYGIAVEGNILVDAVKWSGLPVNNSTEYSQGSWMSEMLRAGGFLTELSDAYSIVTNTFDKV